MRARVTNLGRGARGFHTAAGIAMLEPGASAVLFLADHPVHEAWVAAGEVSIVPEEGTEAPASRPRAPARPGGVRHRDP